MILKSLQHQFPKPTWRTCFSMWCPLRFYQRLCVRCRRNKSGYCTGSDLHLDFWVWMIHTETQCLKLLFPRPRQDKLEERVAPSSTQGGCLLCLHAPLLERPPPSDLKEKWGILQSKTQDKQCGQRVPSTAQERHVAVPAVLLNSKFLTLSVPHCPQTLSKGYNSICLKFCSWELNDIIQAKCRCYRPVNS